MTIQRLKELNEKAKSDLWSDTWSAGRALSQYLHAIIAVIEAAQAVQQKFGWHLSNSDGFVEEKPDMEISNLNAALAALEEDAK